MFSFLKKKKTPKLFSKLKVDIHSHLIPAIDDGSQSMEESLSLLKGMHKLGYEKVITTPHIMADAYRNTPKIILEGLHTLQKAAKEEKIDIAIEAAAEYYLDDGFLKLMEKGEMLTFGERYLLFETSYISKPLQLEEMIFEMTSAGYIPVMAHPERYRYIRDPQREYSRFKELGVLFQSNLNSFGGHYGKSAKELANFLSSNGMIDFLGSDLHGKKHLESLEKVLDSDLYHEVRQNNRICNDELL